MATSTSLPLSLIVTHGSLRIGFLNGFTVTPRGDPLSLLTLARQWNVDVLVWGNGGGVEAYTLEGKFFVNPGSATGAWCGEWEGEGFDEDEQQEDITDKVAKLDVEDDDTQQKQQQQEEKPKKEESKDEEDSKEEVKPEESVKEPTSTSHIASTDETKAKDDEENQDTSDSESEYDVNDLYDTIPSFTLLDIQGTSITLYIYTLTNGEVKVDKVSYRRPTQIE